MTINNQRVSPFIAAYRYGIVGAIGSIIHISLIVLFVEIFQFHPVISTIIGFLVVVLISYVLNSVWTFEHAGMDYYSLFKYAIVSTSGLVLNAGIMFLVVEIFGESYFIAIAIAFLIVPAMNFLFNRYWVFKHALGK